MVAAITEYVEISTIEDIYNNIDEYSSYFINKFDLKILKYDKSSGLILEKSTDSYGVDSYNITQILPDGKLKFICSYDEIETALENYKKQI